MKNSNLYNTDQDKKSKLKFSQIEDYIVPIIAVFIFFGLLFFIDIPSIKSIFDKSTEIKELSSKIQIGQSNIEALKKVKEESQTNKGLVQQLDSIIPTSKTEVVAFQKKISDIALLSNIKVKEVVVGEKILLGNGQSQEQNGVPVEEQQGGLQMVQIPLQFSLVGEIGDFENFLKNIYSGNDFIVVTEMSIKKSSTEDQETTMDLVLSKYQYLPIKEDDPVINQLITTVPADVQINPKVLEFINRKTTQFNPEL